MKSDDLIKSIKLNMETIYINILYVFGIKQREFEILILNLINSFKYNDNSHEKNFSMNVFSIEKLKELKRSLENIGLTEEEINMIIIKSPMIILYSNNLGYIYYLFKSKRYYGYTILDDNKINTYLLNRRLKSNIISNNYVVEKMINYYKVNNYNKETFDDLERDFKLKNYYFKKK